MGSAVPQFYKQQKIILMRIRIEFFRNSTNIKKLYFMRLRIEFCSSAILQFYILQKSIFKETLYWVLQFRNSANLQFYNSTIHKNTEHGWMVLYIEFCNSAILQFRNSTNCKKIKRLYNAFCNSAVLQSYNSTNHKTHNMV